MSHKKNTDPEGSMEELIAHAMETAKAPFNSDRKPSLPSLKSCAAAVRIKKRVLRNALKHPEATAAARINCNLRTLAISNANAHNNRDSLPLLWITF